MATRPLVIDTDGGVDDALAILLACASPEADLAAITTVAGNVPVAQATQNVALILGVAGRADGVEICEGHDRPLMRDGVTAREVHGEDGLGGVTRSASAGFGDIARIEPSKDFAPERLIALARQHGPDLTIVAIGPLTNLAAACLAAPEAMAAVGALVIMGGAVTGRGNVTPAAEFNFFADPEAAAIVFRAAPPKLLVPLETTHQVSLTRDQVRRWSQAHPSKVARFVEAITAHYMNFYRRRRGVEACHPHDALAVAAALDESLFRIEDRHVTIETRGALTAGMSLADDDSGYTPNARVCSAVDAEAFLALMERRIWRGAADR